MPKSISHVETWTYFNTDTVFVLLDFVAAENWTVCNGSEPAP